MFFKIQYFTDFTTLLFFIGSPFAQGLVDNLIKRRSMIMNNAMMLSSLYLDPRFSFELSSTEREFAIRNILNIHRRLHGKGIIS